jgi:hypothetical protein
MVGSSFATLKHQCSIVYQGAHNPLPEFYNDYAWLAGFFADGKSVHALVHNEFHGNERPGICSSQDYNRCWENSITAAVSDDGGYHFHNVDKKNRVIAELPYKYKGDQMGPFGYFNPTNVVKNKQYYYFMFSAIDRFDADRSGVCLARTENIDDPASWRAWDGSGFNVSFLSPYTKPQLAPAQHTCSPLAKGRLFFSLGSLLWMPSANRFLLVMRLQRWDRAVERAPTGAYLSTSDNLIDWSVPTLLLADEATPNGSFIAQAYPSIIDPASPDQNFSTVGNSALLFTKTIVQGGRYDTWQLWARHVAFEVQTTPSRD